MGQREIGGDLSCNEEKMEMFITTTIYYIPRDGKYEVEGEISLAETDDVDELGEKIYELSIHEKEECSECDVIKPEKHEGTFLLTTSHIKSLRKMIDRILL